MAFSNGTARLPVPTETGNHSGMEQREAFVALNMIEGMGPVRVRQLLEQFGDPVSILGASSDRLKTVRGIGADLAERVAAWERTVNLSAELKRVADAGCHVITQADDNYPPFLREIYDPPIVLYVKGTLDPADKSAVAMVGSRQTTHYGLETARKLAYQLAYVGVTVVSGGARGIDTAAHQGALSAKGRTIAVLGNGIKILFSPRYTLDFARIFSTIPRCPLHIHICGFHQGSKKKGRESNARLRRHKPIATETS